MKKLIMCWSDTSEEDRDVLLVDLNVQLADAVGKEARAAALLPEIEFGPECTHYQNTERQLAHYRRRVLMLRLAIEQLGL